MSDCNSPIHTAAARSISTTTLLLLMDMKIEKWFTLKGVGYHCNHRYCQRVFAFRLGAGCPLKAMLDHVSIHERAGVEFPLQIVVSFKPSESSYESRSGNREGSASESVGGE